MPWTPFSYAPGSYTQRTFGDQEGLRVVIEPIPGVTQPDLLPQTGFYFQCPPLEEFAVDYAHSHADYETVSGGQFSRRGSRQLRTTSFETLAVDGASWAFYGSEFDSIENIAETLISVCESGAPVLLTVAHQLPPRGYDNWRFVEAGPELQMPATMRTLRVSERAGEGDTRYFSCAFTEYRDPVVQRERRGRQRGGGAARFPRALYLYADGTARDEDGNRYGEPPTEPVTMRLLARKFYGDPFNWEVIARENGIYWGPTDALVNFPTFAMRFMRGQERTKLTIPYPDVPDLAALKRLKKSVQDLYIFGG